MTTQKPSQDVENRLAQLKLEAPTRGFERHPLIVNAVADLPLTHHLRGYDAVHLATALAWQTQRAAAVTFVTFDRQLWDAGKTVGLAVWPAARP